MKKLAVLAISILLLSCNDKPKGSESKIFTEKAVSDFIRIHPEWDEGGKVNEETTEKFKHMMVNLSNEADFLKDLPFELKELKDTTISNQSYKLGLFTSFKDEKRDPNALLNDLDYRVNGLMHADQVSVEVGNRYLISGTVFKQAKRATITHVMMGDRKMYILGNFTFFVNSAKAIK